MWVKKGRLSKNFFWCKKCTQALGINNNCDNFYRNWVRSLRILFSNSHTHSLFLLRLERRDPGVWRCQDCRNSTCLSECLRVRVTWGSTQSRSCWGREHLGRRGWLSPMRAAGAFFSLKSRFYQGGRDSASHYVSIMHYLPMPLKVLRYEGAVFVGVGVEGERRQHDRGWTFNSSAMI